MSGHGRSLLVVGLREHGRIWRDLGQDVRCIRHEPFRVDREVRREGREHVRDLRRVALDRDLVRGLGLARDLEDRLGRVALRVRYLDRARSRECVRLHGPRRAVADRATRRRRKAR